MPIASSAHRRPRHILMIAALVAGTALSLIPARSSLAAPLLADTSGNLLSLTVDAHGRVYFGEQYALGILDPGTYRARLLPVDATGGRVTSIAPAATGTVWYAQGSYDTSLHRLSPLGCGAAYALGSTNESPSSVVVGRDGNPWFTTFGGPGVGTIAAGQAKEFTLPTAKSQPFSIIVGPGGDLWFTEYAGNALSRVTPAGKITEYHMPIARLDPGYLATGPDGALWFTSDGGLARMSLAGVTTVINPDLPIAALAMGPRHLLWLPNDSESGPQLIGIDAGGTQRKRLLPGGHTLPAALATAPDGSLWFTEPDSRQIVHMTNDGALHTYPVPILSQEQAAALARPLCGPRLDGIPGLTSHAIPLPDAARQAKDVESQAAFNVAAVAPAPDGSAWLTEPMRDAVAHVGMDGTIKDYRFPTQDCGCPASPEDVTVTADGIAYATDSGNTIDRIDPTTDITATFNVGTIDDSVSAIKAAPDGTLYFADSNSKGDALMRMLPTASSPATMFTSYALPVKGETISAIAVGPGGAVWVAGTTYTRAIFSRFDIATHAFVATYSQAQTAPSITGLAIGPDGALWYLDGFANAVGRVSSHGIFARYPIPAEGTAHSGAARSLVPGSNNDLWFGSPDDASLGRVTVDGAVTVYRLPRTANGSTSGPEAIAAGPAGALWYVAAGPRTAKTSKIVAPAGDMLVRVGLPATIPPVPAESAPSGS